MSQASQGIFQGISLLLTQHRVAEARAELERVLALDPEDPEAQTQAADVYAYIGAQAEAYRHFHRAAEAYNRMGRADRALAVHHKMLELDPAAFDEATQARLRLLALLVAAEDALVARQPERAVAAYREAIRQFPNHTITYQRLASLLVRLDRVDEAAEQYLTVARAFHTHGVRAKARPYFERVLELRPAHAEALGSLLDCLAEEGREAEGARALRAAVESLLKAGDQAGARALFARFGSRVALAPPQAAPAAVPAQGGEADAGSGAFSVAEQAAWRTLGEVCLSEGLRQEAGFIFRRLLAHRPTYPVYAELLRRAEGAAVGSPEFPVALAPPEGPSPSAPAVSAPRAAPAPPAAPAAARPASPAYVPPWTPRVPKTPPPPVPRLATLQPTTHTYTFGELPVGAEDLVE